MNRLLSHSLAKPLVFALCLLPLSWLLYRLVQDQLGANPQEALIRATGDWALRFLVIVLAVTPLRELSGLSALARYRRMLGVFMYFYALLHFLSYSGFDMGFDVADIFNDIVKRPFILVGSLALLLLTPLAATSFNAAIRAVGAQRWQRLHRLVYAVAGLAILHFFWIRAGKNDFAEVLVYAGILALLLGWRLRKLRPRPR
ncbi:MAG: sulfoxide reductase heme-binding subunit YedZ [Polaromonas sp.]|nr:sulfoxide reductase heme-binding subunit YedZ [Polaromonas sp.]